MSVNCQTARREIDEAASGELLSRELRQHLNDCPQCASFGDESQKIRALVASLGTVQAPSDFDFRLRARIAAAEAANSKSFSRRILTIRSVAFASLILLAGMVAVVTNSLLRTNQSAPPAIAQAPAIQPANNEGSNEVQPAVALNASRVTEPPLVQSRATMPAKRIASPPSQFVARNGNGKIKATDLSASAARVLRPGNPLVGSPVFPLDAAYQSLKVSVDDGRGSSRTITLPTVSFGSPRALARNPQPINASMRDSW